MDLFYIMTNQVRRMSHVHRYSSFPVHRRENVAEHSWWVSFIALLITHDLQRQGIHVSAGDVLGKALVHDLDECISGDIIRSYKYRTEEMRLATHDAAVENMREITSKMGRAGQRIYFLWEQAKNDTPEGKIVRFADMATVVFYCREERRLGNVEIEAVLKEMYTTWFFEYHDDPLLGQYADGMFPHRMWQDAFASSGQGEVTGASEGMTVARPIMRDASEGPTLQHHDWPMPSTERGV